MGCGTQVGAARAEAGPQQPPPKATGALGPAQPGVPRPVVSREGRGSALDGSLDGPGSIWALGLRYLIESSQQSSEGVFLFPGSP